MRTPLLLIGIVFAVCVSSTSTGGASSSTAEGNGTTGVSSTGMTGSGIVSCYDQDLLPCNYTNDDGVNCFSWDQMCDGVVDCSNGADESTDPVYGYCYSDGNDGSCDPTYQFSCSDGEECIDRSLVCDGNPDCYDGSDETHCNLVKSDKCNLFNASCQVCANAIGCVFCEDQPWVYFDGSPLSRCVKGDDTGAVSFYPTCNDFRVYPSQCSAGVQAPPAAAQSTSKAVTTSSTTAIIVVCLVVFTVIFVLLIMFRRRDLETVAKQRKQTHTQEMARLSDAGTTSVETQLKRDEQMLESLVSRVQSLEDRFPDEKAEATYTAQTMSCFGESTVHGLPKVVKDDNPMWIRVFWAVLFLMGFGAFLKFFMDQINLYASNPTSTSTDYSYSSALQFPAITICNLSPVRQSALDAAGVNWGDPTHPITDAQLQQFGYSFKDMFKVTKFNGRGVNNTKLFYSYVAGAYGNCYVFNYPDSQYAVKTTGPGTGAYFEININQSDYLFGSDGSRAGLLVYVHSQQTPPTASTGITVAPGVYNSIAIQQVSISRLDPPYGSCSQSVTANNARYSVSWCFEECLISYSLQLCGCKPLTYSGDHPKYFNATPCIDNNKCVADLQYRLGIPNLDPSCNCPPPCAETRFNLISSPAEWPSTTALKKKLQQLHLNVTDNNVNEYRRNFLALDVYYSDLNLQTVTQSVALDTATFLGNVGGILGVFVGGSLLSAAEIAVLLITTTIVISKATRRRNEVNNMKDRESGADKGI